MIVRAECHALLGPINPGDQISDTWGMALATDHSRADLHGHTRKHNQNKSTGTLQAHTQSQQINTNMHYEPWPGPRTRAHLQTDVLSRKLFFPNVLSFSYFSHIIICMSAWWNDSHADKTLCSMQLLHLSHAYRLKIAYLAQGHRQCPPTQEEREPDVQLLLFRCLRLCWISNCLCERLWPVGGKWYRQQPFCICLY